MRQAVVGNTHQPIIILTSTLATNNSGNKANPRNVYTHHLDQKLRSQTKVTPTRNTRVAPLMSAAIKELNMHMMHSNCIYSLHILRHIFVVVLVTLTTTVLPKYS